MAKKLDLKKTIRGKSFFTKFLPRFGSTMKEGDQSIFDSRGAITITDKIGYDKNGDQINIRGIKDAGSGSSMVISAPSSGATIDSATAMKQYSGWPYGAIKAKADAISAIEWRIFTFKNGEKIEIEEHELLDLLEAPNEYQTGPDFRTTLASHLELTGNAYIYLENVNDDSSIPTAIHLLNPGSVKVLLDKTTYPYKKTGYKFIIDGREFSFATYQICHIKYPNPGDPFVGIGPTQGIAEWITNDRSSSDFLHQFFKNGAQIGVTFKTDMTSEEQLHELRDSFNEQHSGVGNAYKAMFLPKGVEKTDNDVKFDDIGMDNISDGNRDKILAGYRVPKTILGAAESDTNRATAETADFVFAKRTIKPIMLLICSYINEYIVPRYGDNVILSFTDPVPEDKTTLSNEMKNAIGGQPVVTVNEARAEYLNKEPIDGGDQLLTLNSFVPATNAGEYSPTGLSLEGKKEVKVSKKMNIGYMPPRTRTKKTQFARNLEIRKGISEALASKITDIISNIKGKKLKELSDKEYEDVILKEKRERNTGYAKEMIKELQKINDEQKKEVLANLDKVVKSQKAIDVTKLFDLDQWINITINALKPIATVLFSKEAEHALKLIDQPGLDVENTPSAKRAINKAMNLMSESYNKDTLKILETKLTEGLEEGYSTQKLATLVSDIYAWKDSYAAERVALTESNRISNEAGKIAWKESGFVKEIKWVTAGSDVCDFCRELDGTVISIEKNFFDKGDTVESEAGETIDISYSDVGGPPLHPNCHCGIRPVVSTTIESSHENVDVEIDDAILELKKLDK
jgi:HK97 family phage portal protein